MNLLPDLITPEQADVARHRRLWLRVLQQTVAEADGRQLYGAQKHEQPGVIRRARRYLTTLSRSLLETCSLAGLSREETLLLVEQNREKYKKGEKK